MTRVMKLTLKLSDFIGTDLEPVIMNKIKQIENELRIKIILNLWYDDGEIESVKLKDFILKWEKTLSIKTVIQISNEIKSNDYIFFDIKPINLSSNSRVRFHTEYQFVESIPNCLNSFYDVAKFTTSDVNLRPQKRNDYED